MKQSLVLPYYYQAEHRSFFLKINEQKNLCLSRNSLQGEWETDEILQQDCRHFAAAPDANDCLHVFAADSSNKLTYFVITNNQVNERPFFLKETSGLFLLSFTTGGIGYFFCNEAKSGKLVMAKHSTDSGWSEDFSFIQSFSLPVCLVIDHSGGLHLLLYDLANGNLTYVFYSQTKQTWANPFQLDSVLQMPSLPALWIDAEENIHFAWLINRSNAICYRIKKAGGWPTGGWQPEHYLPVETVPALLSFYEEPECLKLWCMGEDNEVLIFHKVKGEWQDAKVETDFRYPVRYGLLGRETFNLAKDLPINSWYFASMPIATGHQVQEHKDEQEQHLLSQIMKLMEDKRNLKALLQKKEESLAQYRIMLERTHESSSKQRSDWKEHANKVEAEMRQLTEELQKRGRENKSLKEQIEQAQKKISAQDATIKESRAEISEMRVKLEQYKRQEGELRATISNLKSELTKKKGIWEKISSALHNKE